MKNKNNTRRFRLIICLLTTLLLLSDALRAQTKFIAYNAGFSLLTGAIGGLIKPHPGETRIQSLKRGAINGGAAFVFIQSGKFLAGQIGSDNQPMWGLPAKIMHSTGASILENTWAGREALSQIGIDFFIFRLDFRKGEEMNCRILPVATIGIIQTAMEDRLAQFDFFATFQLGGTPVFRGNPKNADGASWRNSVLIRDNHDFNLTLSHELIHIFQAREYMFVNAAHKHPKAFYLDYSIMGGLYLLEQNTKGYAFNWFEEEARFYEKF